MPYLTLLCNIRHNGRGYICDLYYELYATNHNERSDAHYATSMPSLKTLAVANYRSLRSIVVPLGTLTLVTGANGSGKSNLYRALRLLSEADLMPKPLLRSATLTRHNRHRITMPEGKVCFQPGHRYTGFHVRFELAALREALIRPETAEVRGAFACFRLDVVQVCLK